MNLNTHPASADQSAVREHPAAAERPHALPESVFSYVFFLFRLIDALGHGKIIAGKHDSDKRHEDCAYRFID